MIGRLEEGWTPQEGKWAGMGRSSGRQVDGQSAKAADGTGWVASAGRSTMHAPGKQQFGSGVGEEGVPESFNILQFYGFAWLLKWGVIGPVAWHT